MRMAQLTLEEVVEALRAHHGEPPPPPATDPFHLVLWENAAYLADDARRAAAFALLAETVGLAPEQILAAPEDALLAVTRHGIEAERFAGKLRECARIALAELGGDVGAALRRPPAEAKRALRRFPGIGEPGAEKILLFTGTLPVLALDSNGLRVLLRLGFGTETGRYAADYASAQRAAGAADTRDFDLLIAAHQLLRLHGQTLCRRSTPRCPACPLRSRCAYSDG